jgi:uncharacterized membrane protein YfcA
VVANVSNTIGLVPGSISGALGYRQELAGQGRRLKRLGIASSLGGITGAVLLLVLPASAFKAIVPVLIALAIVLVIVQPAISRLVARRRTDPDSEGGFLLLAGVFGTGVYGGYFGAAQGVLLLAILGLGLQDSLQRLNGLKNVLVVLVNGLAALLFIFSARVAWGAAAALAAGAILGGQVGAKVGRRLPAAALRVVIVCVGIIAIIKVLA